MDYTQLFTFLLAIVAVIATGTAIWTRWKWRRVSVFYVIRHRDLSEQICELEATVAKCQQLRELEGLQLRRALADNEKAKGHVEYLMGLQIGVTRLIDDLTGPKKPGDRQLPGNHPLVYGINDETREYLISRLDEIALITPKP